MPWYSLTIIIFDLVCMLILAYNVINRLTLGRFSIWLIGVLRGKKAKERKAQLENMDLYYPITRVTEISIQINNIKYRDLIANQMTKAEEYVLKMKNISLEYVIKYLMDKEVGGVPVHHADYLNFKSVLQEFFLKGKDMIRQACLRNGFVEKTELEYEKYIEDMLEKLGTTASTFFSENFINHTIINLDELTKYENNKKTILERFQEEIKDLFKELKNIAKKEQGTVEKLINERDEIYDKLGIPKDYRENLLKKIETDK